MTTATLGIAVNSNADKATVDLDRLAASAVRAETATKKLSAASPKVMQPIVEQAPKAAAAIQRASLQTANLAAQLNDIGVTLASGQSPFLIALQQGSQINQVLGQQGARGAVTALGAAFMSLVNPVSLATIGIIAFGGMAVQALGQIFAPAENATDALKRHGEELSRLVAGYDQAEAAVKDFITETERLPRGVVQIELGAQFEEMTKQAKEFRDTVESYQNTFSVGFGEGRQQMADLLRQFSEGTVTAGDLAVRLAEMKVNPDLPATIRAVAATLLDGANAAASLQASLVGVSHALAGTAWNGGVATALQSQVEAERSAQAHKIEMDAIRAKTPEQLADIARRRESLRLRNQDMTEALRQQKIEEAAQLAYARGSAAQAKSEAKAYDARKALIQSIEDQIAKSEMEAEALGLSEEAAARLRAEFEVLQRFRQAGITPDPGQVDDFVDRMAAAEAAVKKVTDALAQQKRQMDQLASAAQTAFGTIMDAMGIGDNPLAKGVGSALGPLMKGDLIGAAIAGITGFFVGVIEAEKKARQAREALAKASFDIESFLKESVGESFTEAEKAMNAFTKRGEEFIKLAQAAGDHTLVARIQQAIAAYAQTVAAAEATAAKQQAIDAATDRVAEARAALTNAYQREASRLDQVIDRWKQLSAQLRDFVSNMRLSAASPLSIYDRMGEARRQFEELAAKALGGDQDAIAKLTGVSQAYLDEAKAYYASSTEYLSIFEDVERTLNQALAKTDTQVSIEEQQRDLLDESVRGLGVINSSVLSVEFAIRALQAALANQQAVGGFDQATYWSPTLKNFYSELQNYKSATGATTIPDEIMGVWNAFAGATSGQQYDQLAAGYTNTLRDLMKGLGIPGYANGTMFHPGGLAVVGERGPELLNLPRGAQVMPMAANGSAANDNALIQRVDRLSAQVERLISAAERGTEAVAGAVHGVRGEVAKGNGRSELASLQRPPARRTGTSG